MGLASMCSRDRHERGFGPNDMCCCSRLGLFIGVQAFAAMLTGRVDLKRGIELCA